MEEKRGHIFTIFDELIQREQKEKLLNQHSCVIWLTGLSGSGKSTIAKWLENKLHAQGYLTKLLDGDNIRNGLNSNLTFSEEDRFENIRRIAEVSRLFLEAGIITIVSFVSPMISMRQNARKIIGNNDFMEVYINTPLEICESRDVKGLYKMARAGEIKDFTGISSPFEEPETPDLEIRTVDKSVEDCGIEIYNYLQEKIKAK